MNLYSKLNNKTIILGVISLLWILVVLGGFGLLGNIGKTYSYFHYFLFGYIGYVWLLGLLYVIYKIGDIPSSINNININTRFIEKTLGIIIGVLALLSLQSLFIEDAGIFGTAFNSVLQPLIGHLGIFVCVVFMFVFSYVLYSGKTVVGIYAELKRDIENDIKNIKPRQNIKTLSNKTRDISLAIKAFFAFPKKDIQDNKINTKEDELPKEDDVLDNSSKEVPRPLTLEELMEYNKENNVLVSEKRVKFDFDDDVYLPSEEIKETNNSEVESINNESGDNNVEDTSSKIRVVPIEEAKQNGFDAFQFQLDSIATLEKFKNLERYLQSNNEEDIKEETLIKLIKVDKTETYSDISNIPNEVTEKYISNIDTNDMNNLNNDSYALELSQEAKPKELIKSYPKKLYSAIPFSSYYDKKNDSKDCLIASEDEVSEILNNTDINNFNEEGIIDDKADNLDNDMLEIQEALDGDIKQAIEAFEKEDIAQDKQENDDDFVEDEIFEIDSGFKDNTNENTVDLNKDANSVLSNDFQKLNVVEPVSETFSGVLGVSDNFSVKMPIYGYVQPNIEPNIKDVDNNIIPTLKEISIKRDDSLDVKTNSVIDTSKDSVQNIEEISISCNNDSINIIEKEVDSQHIADTYIEEQTFEENNCIEKIDDEIAAFEQGINDISNNMNEINEEKNKTVIDQSTDTITNVNDTNYIGNNNIKHDFSNELCNDNSEFVLPRLEFLQKGEEICEEIDEGEIDRKINDLLGKLKMFKIDGDIVRTFSGPIVTTFEFRPSPNVKVSRILTLQDDLAMALRAKTIRIQAPIPGKDVVGIEIPNNTIETIYLRDVLESSEFKQSESQLTLALGKDIVGKPFVTDLKKLPHLLIAGTTGSGKSVGINAMILSLLYRNSPDELKLIMIDPKMLEFSIYNDIPHLLTPVITQPKKAIMALDSTVKEMERRYSLMSEAKTKNIEGYNQKAQVEGFEPFPYIVVIIDELADLMMTGGKDAEVSISRLAQMARASGIHLIVATQRPSVDVVTGLIKANLPSRISYKVGQKIDSKVILDTFGAESLLGRGDMLFTPPGGGIVRVHAPWSSETEIDTIVEFIKSQRSPQYDDSFMPSEDDNISVSMDGETDELYSEAKRIILTDRKTSISYLQRRLGIGYNKAANIIEQMQAKGFLSEPNSKGVRDIIGD